MARIRSIKPEFWVDEKVTELSAFARLLFIGLWNFADDEGRMVYSPRKIKNQIFPADALDILLLFAELERQCLIVLYEAEGQQLLQIPNFAEHQKLDKRTPSRLPAPPVPAESPRLTQDLRADSGSSIPFPGVPPTSTESLRIPSLDQGSRNGKGEENTPLTPQGGNGAPEDLSKHIRKRVAQAYAEANDGAAAPWGESDDRKLTRLLAACPTWTAEDWDLCIAHLFESDRAPSDPPAKWLGNLPSYRAAPLDRYRQPRKLPSSLIEGGRHAEEPLPVDRPDALPAGVLTLGDVPMAAWQRILKQLRKCMDPHAFNTWLAPTIGVAHGEQVLYVSVPTRDFVRIGERYAEEIAACADGVRVVFGVYAVESVPMAAAAGR